MLLLLVLFFLRVRCESSHSTVFPHLFPHRHSIVIVVIIGSHLSLTRRLLLYNISSELLLLRTEVEASTGRIWLDATNSVQVGRSHYMYVYIGRFWRRDHIPVVKCRHARDHIKTVMGLYKGYSPPQGPAP